MLTHEVSGFPEYVGISFTCPKCGRLVEESICIPAPNYLSEHDSFSATRNDEFFDISCSCGFSISAQATGSCSGSFIYLDDIDEDYPVAFFEKYDEYDEFDWIHDTNSSEYYESFKNSLTEIKYIQNISFLAGETNTTLNKMLYSQLITCLEVYLSSALASNVFSKKEYYNRFVESYAPFQKSTIQISKVLETYSNMESIIKNELSSIVYHNIPKVSKIYNGVFGISFPPIDDICKIISTRHDLVHRNGMDKAGNKIEISKAQLDDVFDKINIFVSSINSSLDSII